MESFCRDTSPAAFFSPFRLKAETELLGLEQTRMMPCSSTQGVAEVKSLSRCSRWRLTDNRASKESVLCVDAEDAAFLAVGMVTNEINTFYIWRTTCMIGKGGSPVVVINYPFDGEIGCRANT